MTMKEGLTLLLTTEKRKRKNIILSDSLGVGVARAGAPDCHVKADYVKHLLDHDFGKPPHILVIPGQLHFMEAEAMLILAEAPKKVLEMA